MNYITIFIGGIVLGLLLALVFTFQILPKMTPYQKCLIEHRDLTLPEAQTACGKELHN